MQMNNLCIGIFVNTTVLLSRSIADFLFSLQLYTVLAVCIPCTKSCTYTTESFARTAAYVLHEWNVMCLMAFTACLNCSIQHQGARSERQENIQITCPSVWGKFNCLFVSKLQHHQGANSEGSWKKEYV